MELQETVEVCDQALKNSSWWKWWEPALTLHAPQVLGVIGRFVPPAPSDMSGPPTYGYSRGQVKKIRDAVLAHARADFGPL
jgi:hypothetical protein